MTPFSLPVDSFPHSWQQGAIPIIMGAQFMENESKFQQISLKIFPAPKFALLPLPCDILAQGDFLGRNTKSCNFKNVSEGTIKIFLSSPLTVTVKVRSSDLNYQVLISLLLDVSKTRSHHTKE